MTGSWAASSASPVASSDSFSEVVGVVGVGRIGLAVCARLVLAGYRVRATDRRSELEESVAEVGGVWIPDTPSLAADVDVLVTVLPGPERLPEVMEEALPHLRAGSAWIDMTSASPQLTRKLGERALAGGVDVLEASVGGSPQEAQDGELQLFVGASDQSVERHRRLLERLGRVEHMGDRGAGYTTKLVVNLLWFGQAVSTAEAFLLGIRSGLDLGRLQAAVGRSSADSAFVRRDLSALAEGDYLPSFELARCLQELDEILAMAHELEVPAELATVVRDLYREAVDRFGHVEGEMLPVALLEERAGVRLRRS